MWMRIDVQSGEIIERDLVARPAEAAGVDIVKQSAVPGATWRPADRSWTITAWQVARVRTAGEAALLREERWSLVKDARDLAEWWGCSTVLGRVDTDPVSQRKVSGAVQLAIIAQAAGQPFALSWTMQDNASIEHDGSAMIALGVAVGMHVAACHAVALGKRAAIDAAADVAAIGAVDIDGGWPDAPA